MSNATGAVEIAPFDEFQNGVFAVGTAVVKLPNIKATMIRIKALSTNADSIYIADKSNSATLTTANGYELEPGDDTGWMPIANLDRIELISGTAAQSIRYICI